MAEKTIYYGLIKPSEDDFYDIQDFNRNADVIDQQIKKQQDAVALLYRAPIPVTLLASKWSGSTAPYAQTVFVPGITSNDSPVLVSMLADGANSTTQKAYIKAFGIISSGTAATGDGGVTFKVYKKPATDCTVGLKGV